MSGRNRGSKAKIHMSKPELPPFLQKMKEQIVADEDAERKEQSQKKRKNRPSGTVAEDDDPTIVKIDDNDLTEEEYKRMKLALETQYKLDSESTRAKNEELDVDTLIQSRHTQLDKGHLEKKDDIKSTNKPKSEKTDISIKKSISDSKKLSYGSSSEDED